MLWWNLWFFVTSYVPSSSLLKLPICPFSISSSGAWPFFVKRNDEDVRQWGCDSKKKQAQHTKKQEWDVANKLEQDMWSYVSYLSYCCLHLPVDESIWYMYLNSPTGAQRIQQNVEDWLPMQSFVIAFRYATPAEILETTVATTEKRIPTRYKYGIGAYGESNKDETHRHSWN